MIECNCIVRNRQVCFNRKFDVILFFIKIIVKDTATINIIQIYLQAYQIVYIQLSIM